MQREHVPKAHRGKRKGRLECLGWMGIGVCVRTHDSCGVFWCVSSCRWLCLCAGAELEGVPILFFANKQDVPHSLSSDECVENFDLASIDGRRWAILSVTPWRMFLPSPVPFCFCVPMVFFVPLSRRVMLAVFLSLRVILVRSFWSSFYLWMWWGSCARACVYVCEDRE